MKRLGIRLATGDRGSQLKAMVEEEVGQFGEKKRRLSAEKVKALEKSFEIDNKLEAERKAKLALEMDLQPRQVAVWFQNRRARWKAKQLERDYGLLKASYDAIKLSFDVLQRDKEALVKQVGQLRSKLKESEEEGKNEAGDAGISVIEVEGMRMVSEPESERQGDASEEMLLLMMVMNDLNQEGEVRHGTGMRASSPAVDLKEGSSDSDSSAVFQEARSPLTTPPSLAKMEEHDFFVGEGARDFFSEQQAPTLQWGCTDRWN